MRLLPHANWSDITHIKSCTLSVLPIPTHTRIYVHTSSHALAERQRKCSVVTDCIAHKDNSDNWDQTERRVFRCGSTRNATVGVILHLSWVSISSCASWQLMAIICFCLSCEASRHLKNPCTLTREACLLSGGPFFCLQPDRERLIPPPSHTFTSHYWRPWLLLVVGNHFRQKTGRWHGREKNTRGIIVSDAVSFQHDLNWKQTWDM